MSSAVMSNESAAAEWRATDTCKLIKSVRMDRGKKESAVELKSGTMVVIIGRDGNQFKVKSGKNEGTLSNKQLDTSCEGVPVSTKAPTTTAPALLAATPTPSAAPAVPKPSPEAEPAVELEHPKTAAAAPKSHTAVQPAEALPVGSLGDEEELNLPIDRKTRVALFPLSANDADNSAVEKKAAAMWADHPSFQLVPARTVKNALQGSKKDCRSDEACLAAAARKAKADFFIVGAATLTAKGADKSAEKTVSIDVRLLDAKRRKPIDRSQRMVPYSNSNTLGDDVAVDLKQIVRKLDPDQFGRLILSMKERNAEVKIDDKLVGMSPLAPRAMPTGAYVLDVSLESYKPVHISFDIEPQADTEISLKLARSDAFIKDYKSKAWMKRGLAIGSLALGGASAIACVSLIIYGNLKNQDTFDRYYAAGRELTTAELQQVASIRSQLNTVDILSVVTGVVAVAAISTGIVLWIIGDDPNAYDGTTPAAAPSLALAPTTNGFMFVGGF